MDLRGNNITIGELISDQRAFKILKREFPSYSNPLTLRLVRNMPLSEVLALSEGRVSREKLSAVLHALEEL